MNKDDIKRKIYDLELYYSQVENNYPSGFEKEALLIEINSSIIELEKTIYNIDTNKTIKIFEYTLYFVIFVIVLVGAYFILKSFIY